MATHALDCPSSMLTATSTSPGFRAPDAGSDLAGLRPPTTSTGTSTSSRGTRCDLPKHKGISAFAVPNPRPGIEHGPGGSVDKLLMTWVEQAVGHAALSIGSAVYDGGDDTGLNVYLYSRAQSVMGGTSQMQRNLIARRILELPA